MIKKLFNLYIRHKTKNLTRIPLFIMTFDWKKFQKDGKKDSCVLNINQLQTALDVMVDRYANLRKIHGVS